ncbi:uncharacterized protein LOC133517428 [Cydia pomonella]|uniref:uncharacterized protein LOC133517428 n=1 Tax=Cydia pomonella TaxID=82600 RepID=UPI002ADE5EA1|nr:uncharacterized protein LOC133517428 [Cydia pomonella]
MAPGNNERHPSHTGTIPKTKARNNCNVPQEAVTPTRRDMASNLVSTSLDWVPVSEYNTRTNYNQSRKQTNNTSDQELNDLENSISFESGFGRFVPVRPQPRALPLNVQNRENLSNEHQEDASSMSGHTLHPYAHQMQNGLVPHSNHANHAAAAVMIVNPTTPNAVTANMSQPFNAPNQNRKNLTNNLNPARNNLDGNHSSHNNAAPSRPGTKTVNLMNNMYDPQATMNNVNENNHVHRESARALGEAIVAACPDTAAVERRLGQIREYIRVTSSLVDTMRTSEDEAFIEHTKEEYDELVEMVMKLKDSESKLEKVLNEEPDNVEVPAEEADVAAAAADETAGDAELATEIEDDQPSNVATKQDTTAECTTLKKVTNLENEQLNKSLQSVKNSNEHLIQPASDIGDAPERAPLPLAEKHDPDDDTMEIKEIESIPCEEKTHDHHLNEVLRKNIISCVEKVAIIEEMKNKNCSNIEDQDVVVRPVSVQSNGSAYSESELWQNEIKNKMELSQRRLTALKQQQERLIKYQEEAKQQLEEISRERQSQEGLPSTSHDNFAGIQNHHPMNGNYNRMYAANQIGVATTLPHSNENVWKPLLTHSNENAKSGTNSEHGHNQDDRFSQRDANIASSENAKSGTNSEHGHNQDDRFSQRDANIASSENAKSGTNREHGHNQDDRFSQRDANIASSENKWKPLLTHSNENAKSGANSEHGHNQDDRFSHRDANIASSEEAGGAHSDAEDALTERGRALQAKLRELQLKKRHLENLVSEFQKLQMATHLGSNNTYSSSGEDSADDEPTRKCNNEGGNIKNGDPFKLMEIKAIKTALQKTKDLMRSVENYESDHMSGAHDDSFQMTSHSNINDNKSEGGGSIGGWSNDGSGCRVRNSLPQRHKFTNEQHEQLQLQHLQQPQQMSHESNIASLQELAQELRMETEKIVGERARIKDMLSNKEPSRKQKKVNEQASPSPSRSGGGWHAPGPAERRQLQLRALLADKQRELDSLLNKEVHKPSRGWHAPGPAERRQLQLRALLADKQRELDSLLNKEVHKPSRGWHAPGPAERRQLQLRALLADKQRELDSLLNMEVHKPSRGWHAPGPAERRQLQLRALLADKQRELDSLLNKEVHKPSRGWHAPGPAERRQLQLRALLADKQRELDSLLNKEVHKPSRGWHAPGPAERRQLQLRALLADKQRELDSLLNKEVHKPSRGWHAPGPAERRQLQLRALLADKQRELDSLLNMEVHKPSRGWHAPGPAERRQLQLRALLADKQRELDSLLNKEVHKPSRGWHAPGPAERRQLQLRALLADKQRELDSLLNKEVHKPSRGWHAPGPAERRQLQLRALLADKQRELDSLLNKEVHKPSRGWHAPGPAERRQLQLRALLADKQRELDSLLNKEVHKPSRGWHAPGPAERRQLQLRALLADKQRELDSLLNKEVHKPSRGWHAPGPAERRQLQLRALLADKQRELDSLLNKEVHKPSRGWHAPGPAERRQLQLRALLADKQRELDSLLNKEVHKPSRGWHAPGPAERRQLQLRALLADKQRELDSLLNKEVHKPSRGWHAPGPAERRQLQLRALLADKQRELDSLLNKEVHKPSRGWHAPGPAERRQLQLRALLADKQRELDSLLNKEVHKPSRGWHAPGPAERRQLQLRALLADKQRELDSLLNKEVHKPSRGWHAPGPAERRQLQLRALLADKQRELDSLLNKEVHKPSRGWHAPGPAERRQLQLRALLADKQRELDSLLNKEVHKPSRGWHAPGPAERRQLQLRALLADKQRELDSLLNKEVHKPSRGWHAPGPAERRQLQLRALLADKQRELDSLLNKEKVLFGNTEAQKMMADSCTGSVITGVNQSYNSEQEEPDSRSEQILLDSQNSRDEDNFRVCPQGGLGTATLPSRHASACCSDSDSASRTKSNQRSRARRRQTQDRLSEDNNVPQANNSSHSLRHEPRAEPSNINMVPPISQNVDSPINMPYPHGPPPYWNNTNKTNQDMRTNQFTQNSHSQTMERLMGTPQMGFPPSMPFNMMLPYGGMVPGCGCGCGLWGAWCWQQLLQQQRELHALRDHLSLLEERWRAETASHTLNNQVAPGNRANNYWDNFRSYSRQNLLSANSKTNADGQPGAPAAAAPLASRSHNALRRAPPPPRRAAPDVLNLPPAPQPHANNLPPAPQPHANNLPPAPQPQPHANNLHAADKRKACSKLPAKNSRAATSNLHLRENPNLASARRDAADKATSKLFDLLRENVYSEVTTLIGVNESHPDFLIQLFKELQLISSDPLRQRVLQSIRGVLSRYGSASEGRPGERPREEAGAAAEGDSADRPPSERAGCSTASQFDNNIVRFLLLKSEEICTPELLDALATHILNGGEDCGRPQISKKRLLEFLSKYEGMTVCNVSNDIIESLPLVMSGGGGGGGGGDGDGGEAGPPAEPPLLQDVAGSLNLFGSSEPALHACPYGGWHVDGEPGEASQDKVDLLDCSEMHNGDLAEADQTCEARDAAEALPDVVDTEEAAPAEADAEWLGLDRVPTRLHLGESSEKQKGDITIM